MHCVNKLRCCIGHAFFPITQHFADAMQKKNHCAAYVNLATVSAVLPDLKVLLSASASVVNELPKEGVTAANAEAAPIKCDGRESAGLPTLLIKESVGLPALSI